MGALSFQSSESAWARKLAPIRRIFPGLEWQPGVLSTALSRNDIVVVSGAPRNISNILMLAVARLKGARTIWWGHYWSSSSKSYRFLFRLLLMKMADAILFYTDGEVGEYRASHGKRDHRIVTALNNGINVAPIAALRQPYHAATRENAIIFTGRLTEKAELPVLLKALADHRLCDVRLEVIGDGPEKSALETLAQELRVDERVVWHRGTTNEQAIARIANKCRLFVYPGSVGLSLIHGMAYGLPVIVHDNRLRHGPEISAFRHGEGGLSFTRSDVESLANAIIHSINSFEEMNRWSARNLQQADNVYNTASMTERFLQLLAQMDSE